MLAKFISEPIKYTGEQLQSLWALKQFGLQGDSIVAFIGPCDVSAAAMVDIVDRESGLKIYSPKMLHFIVEHFDMDLEKTVFRQRLLVCLLKDELNRRLGKETIERRGDDLFDGEYKLSVSIATLSPVSTLIHVGVNIETEGTPVLTKGLKDYRIEPKELAGQILQKYVQEMESIKLARCKVKGVK